VPLQAADVLAYEANHVIRDPAAKRRPSWLALSPEQKGIDLLHYGKGNMSKLISSLTGIHQRLIASGWNGLVE
jgi:hypothetical protein